MIYPFDNRSGAQWTSKLPALAAAVLFILAAAVMAVYGRSPRVTIAAVLVLLLGVGFAGYSLTVKEWCVPSERPAFSGAFAPSLRGCLRLKGWTEF